MSIFEMIVALAVFGIGMFMIFYPEYEERRLNKEENSEKTK